MSSKIRILLADTDKLKQKAFELRREVFVDEQGVSQRDEFDEFEGESRHYVALDENQDPVGAARWRVTPKGIKLERFAVKRDYRGAGIGSRLVDAVLKDINSNHKESEKLYLHAQLSAIPLYEKFGFQKVGDQFSECDILHYKMERMSS